MRLRAAEPLFGLALPGANVRPWSGMTGLGLLAVSRLYSLASLQDEQHSGIKDGPDLLFVEAVDLEADLAHRCKFVVQRRRCR